MCNYISRPRNIFWAQTNPKKKRIRGPEKAQNDPKPKIRRQKILQNKNYQLIWVNSKTKFWTTYQPTKRTKGAKGFKKKQLKIEKKKQKITKWKLSIYMSTLNSTSTQLYINSSSISTQPQHNLNSTSTSTQPQLNLNLISTSNQSQPQPQLNPNPNSTLTSKQNQVQVNLNHNLNSIWLWHKSNPVLFWQTLSRSPQSKSKVQVQVWADDWVFIKIRFSNHPASRESLKRSETELYFQNKRC